MRRLFKICEWIQAHAWPLAVTAAFALLLLPTVLLIWRHALDAGPWTTSFIATAWDARLWPISQNPLPKWLGGILVWIAFVTSGIAYIRQLQSNATCDRGKTPFERATTWRWAFIWMGLLAFVVPFHSRDLFGYVYRGVELGLLGVNPYVTPVGDLAHWQSQPLLTEHWLENPSPYGFAFTALCGAIVWLFSCMGAGGILLAFKAVMILAHVGVGLLVSRLSAPEQADRNLRLVLWHPLLLLQLVANGHNDGLMALFLLLALWLTLQSSPTKRLWSLPALMMSILVKWLPIVTMPFFVMALWQKKSRTRWGVLLGGSLLALGVLVLSIVPFWPEFHQIRWQAMADNAGMSQHSIQSSLYRIGFYLTHWFFPDWISGLDGWRQGIKTVCWSVYGVGFGWILWHYQRRAADHDPQNNANALTWAVCAVLTGLITVASSKFHAWYLGLMVPIALTLPLESRLRRAVLILSVVQLLAFTPLENAHVLNGILLVALPLSWPFLSNQSQKLLK